MFKINPINQLLNKRHLDPNHCLVVTSSLICLPALLLLLTTPYPLESHFPDIVFLILMSSLSICRWADPNPLFRKCDRNMAKLFFIYYAFYTITTKPNKMITIYYVILIITCYRVSKFFRQRYAFKYWYIFHMLFHIIGIYCITSFFYEIDPLYLVRNTSFFSILHTSNQG